MPRYLITDMCVVLHFYWYGQFNLRNFGVLFLDLEYVQFLIFIANDDTFL